MTKILFVIHNKKNLDDFKKLRPEALDCSIYVKFNDRNLLKELSKRYQKNLKISKKFENLGYFGGMSMLLQEFEIDNDFIISGCDMYFDKTVISHLQKKYGNTNSIVGPKVVDRTGIIIQSPGLRRGSFKTLFSHNVDIQTGPRRVDYISGTFMYFGVVENSAEYLAFPHFMYCEEIYVSVKAIENRVNILYDPDITIVHDYSTQLRRDDKRRLLLILLNSIRLGWEYEGKVLALLVTLNAIRNYLKDFVLR